MSVSVSVSSSLSLSPSIPPPDLHPLSLSTRPHASRSLFTRQGQVGQLVYEARDLCDALLDAHAHARQVFKVKTCLPCMCAFGRLCLVLCLLGQGAAWASTASHRQVCLFVCLSVCLYVCVSVCLHICPYIFASTRLCVCVSWCLRLPLCALCSRWSLITVGAIASQQLISPSANHRSCVLVHAGANTANEARHADFDRHSHRGVQVSSAQSSLQCVQDVRSICAVCVRVRGADALIKMRAQSQRVPRVAALLFADAIQRIARLASGNTLSNTLLCTQIVRYRASQPHALFCLGFLLRGMRTHAKGMHTLYSKYGFTPRTLQGHALTRTHTYACTTHVQCAVSGDSGGRSQRRRRF